MLAAAYWFKMIIFQWPEDSNTGFQDNSALQFFFVLKVRTLLVQ